MGTFAGGDGTRRGSAIARTLFIEVRKKFEKVDFSILDELQGKIISLASTIQYLDLVPKVKKYLESRNKKVVIKKGAYHVAHVLGCKSQAFDEKADTLLLLADGKFHALNNAVQLQKEIYIFNTRKLEKISSLDIESINKKTKGKQNIFLHAEKVGIIISTKHGQLYNRVRELKQRIENQGKQVYVFETDIINIAELENFTDIKIWVNTACYGLGLDDRRIINLKDVLEFL